MNIITYLQESSRTESHKFYIENISKVLLHGVIGICTEAAELLHADNKENVREEIGDIMWYIAAVMRAQKIDPFKFQNDAAFANINSPWLKHYADWPLGAIVILGGELLDYVKKVLFYGVPMNQVNLKIYTSLTLLYAAVMAVAIENGWVLEDILDENIAKLRVRYPDKFTEKDAKRRADKDE